MTRQEKLYMGISRVAWGYFFLYFDINLNTVSILPSFVGYLLFLSAIDHLKEEERELGLLPVLGGILTLWHTVQWLVSWGGGSLEGLWQFADVTIGIINLYFHFQLITNIASIAKKYQPKDVYLHERLLKYRSVQTVVLTFVMIIQYLRIFFAEGWAVVSLIIIFVYFIVCICLMKAMFDLRRMIRGADFNDYESDTADNGQ